MPDNPSPLLGHSDSVYREPFVGVEHYDGYTRQGTSKDIRGLRIGRKRWRIELSLGGLWLRLGSVAVTFGVEWADDDA